MSESGETYDPPQDTGAPDAVETDPAALSSAEDLGVSADIAGGPEAE